jgi:hypothetical protein
MPTTYLGYLQSDLGATAFNQLDTWAWQNLSPQIDICTDDCGGGFDMGFSVSTFITIDAPNLQVVGTASAVLYGFDENEEEYGEPDIRFDTLTMDGADVQTSSAAGDGPFEVNYNLLGSLSYSGVYTIAGSATATVELWDEPDWIGHDSDTRFATYNGPTCSSPVITGIQIMPQGQTQTQPTSGLLVNSSGTLSVNAACIDSSAQLSVNSSDVMVTSGEVSNGTILANYTVLQGAQPGSRTLTLTTTSNGASTNTTIEIASTEPFIDSITLNSWPAGQTTGVTITGAGFGGGPGGTPGTVSFGSQFNMNWALTSWADNAITGTVTPDANDPGENVTVTITGGTFGLNFLANQGNGKHTTPASAQVTGSAHQTLNVTVGGNPLPAGYATALSNDINGAPYMPQLNATIAGGPTGTATYQIKIQYTGPDKSSFTAYYPSTPRSLAASATWYIIQEFPYQVVLGGNATIYWTYNNVPQPPFPFSIVGTNPTVAQAQAYLTSNPDTYTWFIQQLVRSEHATQSYTQFNGSGAPDFGSPGGYGMMQVDTGAGNAIASDMWNWQQNVVDGKATLVSCTTNRLQ